MFVNGLRCNIFDFDLELIIPGMGDATVGRSLLRAFSVLFFKVSLNKRILKLIKRKIGNICKVNL